MGAASAANRTMRSGSWTVSFFYVPVVQETDRRVRELCKSASETGHALHGPERCGRADAVNGCSPGPGRPGDATLLFPGDLPIMSGASMAQFLQNERVDCGNLKRFLLETSERVKGHAQRMAEAAGRPYIYLPGAGVRMEQQARELAAREGIREGLVCVFAKLEPCKTFSFKYSKGDAYVHSAKRKCLHFTTTSWSLSSASCTCRCRAGFRCGCRCS